MTGTVTHPNFKMPAKITSFLLAMLILLCFAPWGTTTASAAPRTGRAVQVNGVTIFDETLPPNQMQNANVPGVAFNPANNTITLASAQNVNILTETSTPNAKFDVKLVVTGKSGTASGSLTVYNGNLSISGTGELFLTSINVNDGSLAIANAKVNCSNKIYANKGVTVNTGKNGALVVKSYSAQGAIQVGLGADIKISGRGVMMEGKAPLATRLTKRTAKQPANSRIVKKFSMRRNAVKVTRPNPDGTETVYMDQTLATRFPYIAIQPVATKLKMSPTSKVMFPGQKYRLSAVSYPYYSAYTKVKYASNNNSVATVDPNTGEVIAVGQGVAKITAKNAQGRKGICTIIVGNHLPSNNNFISYIEINRDRIDLNKGKAYTLSAKVYPANASNTKVLWESSDPAVATVNPKGKVVARRPGQCIITVETAEGGYRDTCVVNVW